MADKTNTKTNAKMSKSAPAPETRKVDDVKVQIGRDLVTHVQFLPSKLESIEANAQVTLAGAIVVRDVAIRTSSKGNWVAWPSREALNKDKTSKLDKDGKRQFFDTVYFNDGDIREGINLEILELHAGQS
jgi:DNA-binding cell septation regulator SpoVG